LREKFLQPERQNRLKTVRNGDRTLFSVAVFPFCSYSGVMNSIEKDFTDMISENSGNGFSFSDSFLEALRETEELMNAPEREGSASVEEALGELKK
jgi:hypothetical protein